MLKERYAYLTHRDQNLTFLSLAEIVKLRHEQDVFIWSARLATGLFGLPSCPSGNRGPKGFNEAILAAGDEGLQFLIRSGFIPCPTCHPEVLPGFYATAAEAIRDTYGYSELTAFSQKWILNFDARRVDWETILPLLGATPDRLYLPPNLLESELISLRERFEDIGFKLPPVGYYDRNSPGNFFQYHVPES